MSTKNKGNKSNHKIAKEQKNQKGTSWRDSRGNHKFLCLHCLKSMKGQSKCCGFNMYHLGSIPRTPKIKAPKSEWKKFFSMFVIGGRSESKGQLHQIIKLRKSYGLPTLEAETQLKKLSEKIDKDIIGVFDIKRHEVTEQYIGYDRPHSKLMDTVQESAKHYGVTMLESLVKDKEYFVVPLFASNYNTYYIPHNVEKFDIQKVRTKMIPQYYGTQQTMGFTVLTNNKKEIINIGYQPDSQYGYRQSLYVFESRVKAMAFRQEFLSIVFPLLKELELPYLSTIVDTVNLDYERVTKKAPQILI